MQVDYFIIDAPGQRRNNLTADKLAKNILPNEDCGLLGGRIDGDKRIVATTYPISDLFPCPL